MQLQSPEGASVNAGDRHNRWYLYIENRFLIGFFNAEKEKRGEEIQERK